MQIRTEKEHLLYLKLKVVTAWSKNDQIEYKARTELWDIGTASAAFFEDAFPLVSSWMCDNDFAFDISDIPIALILGVSSAVIRSF